MVSSLLEKADIFRPFDELLEDRAFWTEFEVEIVRLVVPMFFEIFVAGAIAGVTIKEKAFPSSLPEPLSEAEIAELAEQAILDYVPEFTKNISAATYAQVRDSVLQARESGKGVEQVLRDIQPLFSRTRAQTIAITETTRLFGIGAQASYRLQGFNGWQWHSVNDPWVDPICAGLNDEKFPMDKLFEPAHPRCRCFPSPVNIEGAKPVEPLVLPPPVPSDARPGTAFPEAGFKTRAQAEAWAAQRFPNVRFVLDNVHISNLNPTLRELDRLTGLYPQVTARLQVITTKPTAEGFKRWSPGTMAWASQDGKRIALNPKFYKDPKFAENVAGQAAPNQVIGRKYVYDADGKMVRNPLGGYLLEDVIAPVPWHPLGTDPVQSVFTHEFGHQVDHWLNSIRSNTSFSPTVRADGSGLISHAQDTFRGRYLSSAPAEDLSRYARKNDIEAFAEAFAQMHMAPRAVWHPSTVALEGFLDVVGDTSRHTTSFGFLGDAMTQELRTQQRELLDNLMDRAGISD